MTIANLLKNEDKVQLKHLRDDFKRIYFQVDGFGNCLTKCPNSLSEVEFISSNPSGAIIIKVGSVRCSECPYFSLSNYRSHNIENGFIECFYR